MTPVPPMPPVTGSDSERWARAMLGFYKAAVAAKDVDTFVGLYDTEVRVFDLWGAWSHDGIDAWRKTVTEWFGSLGDGWVSVEMDEVRVVAADELAVAHAIVTYRGMSGEGVELQSMQNRLTWTICRRGDAWKIVHEHSSAPVDPETVKVMLRRPVP